VSGGGPIIVASTAASPNGPSRCLSRSTISSPKSTAARLSACPHCNRFKGPNVAGIDPQSGETVRLFHPRKDDWYEHFAWEGARLTGRTAVGRATVQVLAMNAEDLLAIRLELRTEDVL